MAKIHQPAEPEDGNYEVAEDLQSVAQACLVCAASNYTEDDRGKEGEQQGGLKMCQVYVPQDLFSTAISKASMMASTLSKPAHTRNFVP